MSFEKSAAHKNGFEVLVEYLLSFDDTWILLQYLHPDAKQGIKFDICGGTLVSSRHVLTTLDCVMKDKNDLTNIPIQSYDNVFVKLGDSGRGWGDGGVFLPVTHVRGHPKAFLDQEYYYNLGENAFYRCSFYLHFILFQQS